MIRREIIKFLIVPIASGLVAGAIVAAVIGFSRGDAPTPAGASESAAPAGMEFGASAEPQRTTTRGCTTAVARTTGAIPAGSRPREARDERYLVRAGDTLWGIATRYYADAAAAMKRIKRRSGLRRDELLAGEILVLPATGRRSDGVPENQSCQSGEAATDDAAREP